MKSYLLWNRFLRYWLPPCKTSGDVKSDINEALRTTYCPSNATFAQKGGPSTIVITKEKTRVASKIPPCVSLPIWLVKSDPPSGSERSEFLNNAIREMLAAPLPHIVLKTGRLPFTLDGIVLGGGTVVVVNEPDKTEFIDSVRIQRARCALEIFGSANQAKIALRLLRDRGEARGAADEIDKRIRGMIGTLGIDPAVFFDALDLLNGVSPRELVLAGEAS